MCRNLTGALMAKVKITSGATAALAEFALRAFEASGKRPNPAAMKLLSQEITRLECRIVRLSKALNFGVHGKKK